MVEIAHLNKKIENGTVIGDRLKRYPLKKQQWYRQVDKFDILLYYGNSSYHRMFGKKKLKLDLIWPFGTQ